jgi:hypothetical protein
MNMPTIGYDCEIIIDGTGYFVKPGTYLVKQPRIRHISYRVDGSLSYTDLGPGRRFWHMTILALNELTRYDGTLISTSGQQWRDALYASYAGHVGTTILFGTPQINEPVIPVYFDHYEERLLDLRTQVISIVTAGSIGASYEIEIELLEA